MSLSTLSSALVTVNRPEGFGPLVVSIPHAGRIYPQEILDAARLRQQDLERLEDRWSDALAADMPQAKATVVMAQFARAAVDCNRGAQQMAATELAEGQRHKNLHCGPKERAGLGVIPTRLAGLGPIWRRPIDQAEWQRRIAAYHQPYHQLLGEALRQARQKYGFAILIDLHSMPSIGPKYVGHGCNVIVGDRFGATSGGWLSELALDACRDANLVAGINRPYAGGYIIEHHANPAQQIFALQLEFDRALYLHADHSLNRTAAQALSKWLAEFARRAALMGRAINDWDIAAE